MEHVNVDKATTELAGYACSAQPTPNGTLSLASAHPYKSHATMVRCGMDLNVCAHPVPNPINGVYAHNPVDPTKCLTPVASAYAEKGMLKITMEYVRHSAQMDTA